jgi:hypothetical protein
VRGETVKQIKIERGKSEASEKVKSGRLDDVGGSGLGKSESSRNSKKTTGFPRIQATKR